jgi:hypothetical protein
VNTGDTAAVVVAVASGIAVVVLIFAVLELTRATRALRETVEELQAQTLPVVQSLRSTVDAANAELDRVDGLLQTAETVTATVDSASRLAYLALSNPVIKVLAFLSGTGRAARRMRRRRER